MSPPPPADSTKRVRLTAVLVLIWIALGILSAAQTAILGNFEWETAWYRAALDWGPWILLAPMVWWLSNRISINRGTWRRALPAHLAIAVLLSILIESLSWFLPDEGPAALHPGDSAASPARPGSPPQSPPGGFGGPRGAFDPAPPPELAFNPDRSRAPDGGYAPSPPRGSGGGRARLAIPIYFLIVAAAHAYAYHARSLERERTMRLAETSLVKARLSALQTQLQPHFFFNALNAVAALVHTRPDLADRMICSLADLMRGVLDVSDQSEIPLRRELAFIDHYLEVQKIRFGERLIVVRDIDESAADCLVPPLLLQPLVENAAVHGVEPRRHPSVLTLRARRSPDGRLRLAVVNTCPQEPLAAGKRPGEPLRFPSRVGLANTHARLSALHGSDYRFEHRLAEDGGVSAEIEIPARLPA